MTPQSHFMVIAPIVPGREDDLRALLASMNTAPGQVDVRNALLPFARFDRLHVARLFVLDDPTLDDITAYGLPRPALPKSLVFLGDCDGPADTQLAQFAAEAAAGLRRVFAHCAGFTPNTDLLAWMRANDRPVAAYYVNTIGRTVRQVREEAALQRVLGARLAHDLERTGAAPVDVQTLRRDLIGFARGELSAGRLTLTPPAPTPFGWWLRNLLHAIVMPLIALAALPFLIVLSPWLVVMLRERERGDPEIAGRPDPAAVHRLQGYEDHDVTNPFSAIGSVKPGLFRRWTVTALLATLDYASRHIYGNGHLTRVQTIHFARWAFLDGKQRLVFASNYDGSLESYMDDFINKVGWGLNLVFSNGVGYPRTDWLVMRGARSEQRFKCYLRRHEIVTDVWYKAYPGLTATDLARNTRIRDGFEAGAMSDAQAVEWLRLL